MSINIDNSLIKKAKSGDEVSLAAIITAMLETVKIIARTYQSVGFDFDDAQQEGLIGLFDAVGSYDETLHIKFETYAQRCVTNAILNARKKSQRKKHTPLNTSVSFESEEVDSLKVDGPEDIVIENEQWNKTMTHINDELSSFEKQVLLLFLDGFSYQEIAKSTDKPLKSVDNALSRIRKKLK